MVETNVDTHTFMHAQSLVFIKFGEITYTFSDRLNHNHNHYLLTNLTHPFPNLNLNLTLP